MKQAVKLLGLMVSLTVGLCAFAQEDAMKEAMAATPVHVAEHDILGAYLVDGQGRTLYVVVNGEETVPCEDDCATAWPPFAEESMEMMAAEGSDTMTADPSEEMAADTGMMAGIDSALLGTVARTDGSTQVTYNGHALYYFVGDVAPGEVNCQAIEQFGGTWYVLSPTGEVITTANN